MRNISEMEREGLRMLGVLEHFAKEEGYTISLQPRMKAVPAEFTELLLKEVQEDLAWEMYRSEYEDDEQEYWRRINTHKVDEPEEDYFPKHLKYEVDEQGCPIINSNVRTCDIELKKESQLERWFKERHHLGKKRLAFS